MTFSLQIFGEAARQAASLTHCVRVEAGGVRTVGAARAFFTLGATHRRAIAAFVDALKEKYGEAIGNLVAMRQGLMAGAGLNGRRARRITGQLVLDSIATARQIVATHSVLLEAFRLGAKPEEIAAPEGLAADALSCAEGHDLKGAIAAWAERENIQLSPDEKNILAEAVYGELAQRPGRAFTEVGQLYEEVAQGKCRAQRLCQKLALLARDGTLDALQGEDAQTLRALVLERLPHCDAVRRGERMDAAKMAAVANEVRAEWDALADEHLLARIRVFNPACTAEKLPGWRRAIMDRLGQAYARRPEGTAWNPAIRLEAALNEVIQDRWRCGQMNARALPEALAGMWEGVEGIAEIEGNVERMNAAVTAQILADPDFAGKPLTKEELDALISRYAMPILDEISDACQAITNMALAKPTATFLKTKLFEERDGVMRYVGLEAIQALRRRNKAGLAEAVAALMAADGEGWRACVEQGVAVAGDARVREGWQNDLLTAVRPLAFRFGEALRGEATAADYQAEAQKALATLQAKRLAHLRANRPAFERALAAQDLSGLAGHPRNVERMRAALRTAAEADGALQKAELSEADLTALIERLRDQLTGRVDWADQQIRDAIMEHALTPAQVTFLKTHLFEAQEGGMRFVGITEARLPAFTRDWARIKTALAAWAQSLGILLSAEVQETLTAALVEQRAPSLAGDAEAELKLADSALLRAWEPLHQAIGKLRPADAALSLDFATRLFCHCDAVREGRMATEAEIQAVADEVRQDDEALADAALQDRVSAFDPALASPPFAAHLPLLRPRIMARLAAAYAERPDGQDWNAAAERERAFADVMKTAAPSPLAKACGIWGADPDCENWQANVQALAQDVQECRYERSVYSDENANKMRAALVANMAADPACRAKPLTNDERSELFLKYEPVLAEAVNASRNVIEELVTDDDQDAAKQTQLALIGALFAEREGVMRFVGVEGVREWLQLLDEPA